MAEEMMMNTAPIPGQSLTKEPGNAPYERPPEISNPEQALMGYLNYLNDPKVLEGMVGLLEEGGFDVTTLVEGLLRGGVADGYHSIDVSLAIQEPIVSFVVNIMDATGIKYKVGDPDVDEEDEDDDLSMFSLGGDSPMNMEEEEETLEEPMENPEVKEGPIKKGLMERGQ
tara:strand:+ start:241 stop:750 length:510 start_codon:yes stop_codon:yes gene_type:complete